MRGAISKNQKAQTGYPLRPGQLSGEKGEQWKESGGAERKRTRNESHEGGNESTAAKQQEQDKREAKIRGHGDKRAEVAREQEQR